VLDSAALDEADASQHAQVTAESRRAEASGGRQRAAPPGPAPQLLDYPAPGGIGERSQGPIEGSGHGEIFISTVNYC
jgi:hypothetical protein